MFDYHQLFITGASRDLGLEIIRQVAELPSSQISEVSAIARGEASQLQDLTSELANRIVIIKLEVISEVSVKHAVSQVEIRLDGKGLDVLITNAGKFQYATLAH
ncbi:hypothetical protein BOTCAL_0103g00170 [Botryotinia calthae]|uniref:Ketoreductase (KR) domain-containing protein n=1 Tax=Botryotinia calthae TaxID=38488 RepID=A0A4Y8D846_9HELO|nr:hypothetical protein BOTCAL_0103g00170 [Botryotinia calthae]